MSPRCGIVVVSHSTRLADGVVELATQMAPDVALRAAGGDDDGGLGTSMTKVEQALSATLDEAGEVVVATDLGSATMIAETALELLAEEQQSRVLLADGPLVEGVVAAAVAAQGGADAHGVRAALEAAADSFSRTAEPAGPDHA
ncbi:dihydroxyacetone kinase phosphoryl donor subunit DhaM, partial [Georgenia sp. 10Sc9-8]|nr:dihydroxyacetone kinase phosphoryl donor subunit DhaM [Georgenia halotolerans]